MKSHLEVSDSIRRILQSGKYSINCDTLTEDTLMFSELGIDSLMFMSLLCDIEEALDCSLLEMEISYDTELTFGFFTDQITKVTCQD